MNNFENQIKEILKKEVSKSPEYEHAIQRTFFEKKNTKNVRLFYKIATIACSCALAITGVASATYIISKIWKEPIIVSQEERDKQIAEIKNPITDEEKEKMITDEDAIQSAEKVLDILEYEKMDFKEHRIVKGYDNKNHFILHTETNLNKSIEICLNPLNGDLEYFCDNAVLSQNLICDNISEEDAKTIANNLYKRLNIINENDEYEIISAKRQNVLSGSNVNDMWQITYAKKYNDGYDKDSAFTTIFSVVNGKTIFHKITVNVNSSFESNPIVLTKEEAIKIATQKEKCFSQLEILETNAKLSVEKMNIFVYALENNITNSSGEYKIDDISRNVWVVEIKHKKDFRPISSDIEIVREQYDKKYFVDATTGEIIGGEQIEYFNN